MKQHILGDGGYKACLSDIQLIYGTLSLSRSLSLTHKHTHTHTLNLNRILHLQVWILMAKDNLTAHIKRWLIFYF